MKKGIYCLNILTNCRITRIESSSGSEMIKFNSEKTAYASGVNSQRNRLIERPIPELDRAVECCNRKDMQIIFWQNENRRIEGPPEQAPANLRSLGKCFKHDSLAYPAASSGECARCRIHAGPGCYWEG
jgi:hypothetical protein